MLEFFYIAGAMIGVVVVAYISSVTVIIGAMIMFRIDTGHWPEKF